MPATTKKRTTRKKKTPTKTAKRAGKGSKVESSLDNDGVGLYASAIASAAVPALFGGVFNEYWQAFQTRQASIQQSTQEAYGEFMLKLQEVWDREDVKSRLNEACREFGTAIQTSARQPRVDAVDGEEAEQTYRDYVDALQGIWNDPDVMEPIEQAFLTFSESVEKATETSREVFEQAQKLYVRGLRNTWAAAADATILEDEAITAVSKSMVATVFFTEGIQGPNA